MSIDSYMYNLLKEIYPICRSITGDGVRETLKILQREIPELTLHEVPTGTKVFDWEVPCEWKIRDAWIKNSRGEKILDFKQNNLSVVGYSAPVDKKVNLAELKEIIYTLPNQKDAIPYVTSYYKERYGFCMTETQKEQLTEDTYHIYIDSELFNGSLTYGEIIIPGESQKEIFLSTYTCHPSLANDNCSGPVVTTALAKYIKNMPRRKYTYRIVYLPETIGSITYLATQNHLQAMKENIIAGFNLTVLGDDRTYTYVATRYGNTLADKVAKNVLKYRYPNYINYSYLHRGSDEREYCSPGVDLPVATICRSKYGDYPEYQTSKDNLGLVSPIGLQGSYEAHIEAIEILEHNAKYKIKCCGEPQLGKRGLYPTISKKGSYDEISAMMNFIAYADGINDLVDISDRIDVPVSELRKIADKLVKADLLDEVTA